MRPETGEYGGPLDFNSRSRVMRILIPGLLLLMVFSLLFPAGFLQAAYTPPPRERRGQRRPARPVAGKLAAGHPFLGDGHPLRRRPDRRLAPPSQAPQATT